MLAAEARGESETPRTVLITERETAKPYGH
jgi:hypothetical protein